MVEFVKFLKILRISNIVVVIAYTVCNYFLVAVPLYKKYDIPGHLGLWDFEVFLLLMGLITIWGYWHNNMKDWLADSINKEYSIYHFIEREEARIINYAMICVIGVAIAYLFYKGKEIISSLMLLSLTLIYLYNVYFKGVPLLGNLIVAFICALGVALPQLFHFYYIVEKMPSYVRYLNIPITPIFKCTLFSMLSMFFICTGREICKCYLDKAGDAFIGKRTIAFVINSARGCGIAFFFTVAGLLPLLIYVNFMAVYTLVCAFIVLVLLLLWRYSIKRGDMSFFKWCSVVGKILIFAGVLHVIYWLRKIVI